MTSKALTDEEVVDYADHHAGTLGVRPGVINPYKLGLELLRDIEERWDKGRFGKEFEEEDDYQVRDRWDTGAAQGREKIFEVRRIYNDVTFIDTFLTEEFCEAQKLFVYRQNPRTGQMEIADRDWTKVKQELLASLTNRGQPHIEVIDGNHKNRGELFLLHRWEGVDLRLDFAQETLKNLHRIWGRPVHIETKVEGKGKLLSFDGEKTTAEDITSPEE
jgi:stage V sporulation protein R